MSQIKLISQSLRDSSKFLLRDYYELETLQGSGNRGDFCQRAKRRYCTTCEENLSKYFQNIFFTIEGAKQADFTGEAVVVHVIDSMENFSRANPFFGIMASVVVKQNGQLENISTVIDFPILGESIKAERNKKAFFERYESNMPGLIKLKLSKTSSIDKAIIAGDKLNLDMMKNISNYRFYGSDFYHLVLFLLGKVDIFVAQGQDFYDAFELFIKEAGGVSFRSGDSFIASNLPLSQKISELLS